MNLSAKRILIKARRNIFGELAGNNISSKRGDGFDFFELRPYTYGEDVRRIDWKRSAKMSAPYIKLFHEEREIQVVMAVMLSGSLHFGLKRFKQDVVGEIVATLGFSALKNNDRYCILTCKEKNIHATKITKQYVVLQQEVSNIIETNLLGVDTSFDAITNHIMHTFKRRSLVVFIGDFWHMPNLSVVSKKHEVLSIIVRDKFEEHPKALGNLIQMDPNTLQRNNTLLDKNAIKERIKFVKQHDNELLNHCVKNGIRATKIYTNENVFSKLSQFLGR